MIRRTKTDSRKRSGLRMACLTALTFAMLALQSCGNQSAAATEAANASRTAAQTADAAGTAAQSAAAQSAAASDENMASGNAGPGAGLESQSPEAARPGVYSVEQSQAEAAIAAAEAAAPYHEADFRKNVGAGMTARWTALDSRNPDSMSLEEFKAYAAESVQAEISAIGDFYLYSFTDKDFETAAGQYMNALSSQMSGIQEISSPEELSRNKNYMQGYWLRIIAICEMAKGGDIPVAEQYLPDLKAILESYESAKAAMTPVS